MSGRIRGRLTYANVMATVAVFIALGGGAYAATTLPRNSVGSTQIKKGGVHSSDLARNAVTSAKVKNGTLLPADFKQMPVGPKGDTGATGATGATGEPGPFPEPLQRGKTLRGNFIAGGHAAAGGELAFDSISYGFTLESLPTGHILAAGAAATPECPGSLADPQAAVGHACFYVQANLNSAGNLLCNPKNNLCSATGQNVEGIVFRTTSSAVGSFYAWGTWAVTAP